MGENNGTRVSPNGEPEIAEIEPVEQINDPSHPDGMGEQSPVVASDSAPVERSNRRQGALALESSSVGAKMLEQSERGEVTSGLKVVQAPSGYQLFCLLLIWEYSY